MAAAELAEPIRAYAHSFGYETTEWANEQR
jgi:hypothetical protein